MRQPAAALNTPAPVRRRRKNPPRRRRVLIWTLEFFIGFGVLAGFAWAFSAYVQESERFLVKTVRVDGAHVLREEAIVAVSGIHANDNLLTLPCVAIGQRIEEMPYVRASHVERLYPDTIVITVEERTPLVTLLLNNHFFELDEEGVVLRELAQQAPDQSPILSSVPGLSAVQPGDRLEHPVLREALALWSTFRQSPLAGHLDVGEIAARAENDIAFISENVPFVLRWARGDYARQVRLLEIWWNEVGSSGPCREYLDLRFGNDLVCK